MPEKLFGAQTLGHSDPIDSGTLLRSIYLVVHYLLLVDFYQAVNQPKKTEKQCRLMLRPS